MNYNIELKHQEKDNQLTISIHVEDLPINCLKNLEYIKEDAEKAGYFLLGPFTQERKLVMKSLQIISEASKGTRNF